jgi:hypothetical protein
VETPLARCKAPPIQRRRRAIWASSRIPGATVVKGTTSQDEPREHAYRRGRFRDQRFPQYRRRFL